MKKVISVLLAVVMIFSIGAVGFTAFAEEDPPAEEPVETSEALNSVFKAVLGCTYDEFNAMTDEEKWAAIQNIDMGYVIFAAKTVKIALKLVKVVIKILLVFDKLGFLDLSEYKNMIVDFVASAIMSAIPAEEAPAEEPAPIPG